MKEYQVAFVGNPNVGKSAWINALSNANFKIGNWPGVTIEKKEAVVTWNEECYHFIDLPGTYALEGATNEEFITSQYLKQQHIDLIVNVVDATNLIRNLYLTLLLRELQIPMIIIFNFMDEVEKLDIHLDITKFSRRLQIPILPYSAFDKKNYVFVQEAIQKGVQQQKTYLPLLPKEHAQNFVDVYTYLSKHVPSKLSIDEKTLLRFTIQTMKQDAHMLSQLATWKIDSMVFVNKVLSEDIWHTIHQQNLASFAKYIHQEEEKRLQKTRRIDSFVLHKWFGLPLCFLCFGVLLTIVFNGSAPFNNFIDYLINQIFAKYMTAIIVVLPNALQQLIVNGIIAGVGGVLTFVPLMAFLYFMLAILEESGYMSRIVFLFDRMMRVFHLSGKSLVALLLGFGCNVPAVYAARTLDNEKQKKLTVLLVPFMSCGARLPVYVLFASAFFQGKAALMILSIYGLGILFAMLMALAFSKIKNFQTTDLFVMELPPYRFPSMSVVFHKVGQEVKSYVKKATTIVLWAMIGLWSLSYFPNGHIQDSYIAQFGKAIAPIYEPLGFGTRWETISALPGSIVAKETVVGFLDQILLSNEQEEFTPINVKEDMKDVAYRFGKACKESVVSFFPHSMQSIEKNPTLIHAIQSLWQDPLANLRAFSYMIYILLCIPCVMTLQAIYREYGWKLLSLSCITMTVLPYIVSLLIFQIFARLFIL